jgi:hypothetical protein
MGEEGNGQQRFNAFFSELLLFKTENTKESSSMILHNTKLT